MEFLIEHRVPDAKVAEQEAIVRVFVAAEKASNDSGLRYASSKNPDGVSFGHHAWMVDESAFRRFLNSRNSPGWALPE